MTCYRYTLQPRCFPRFVGTTWALRIAAGESICSSAGLLTGTGAAALTDVGSVKQMVEHVCSSGIQATMCVRWGRDTGAKRVVRGIVVRREAPLVVQ